MATHLLVLVALSLMAESTSLLSSALQMKPSSVLQLKRKNERGQGKKTNYVKLTSSHKFVLSASAAPKDSTLSSSMMAMTIDESSSESDKSTDDPILAYLNKKNAEDAEMLLSTSIQQHAPSTRKRANVLWRHIPMQHLRMHPLYDQLPERVIVIKSSKDLSLFRQGTVQWDILHNGRLTTSKIQSCLGFYEAKAARALKIPKSLTGHVKAIHARQLLLSKAVKPREWGSLLEMYKDEDSAVESSFGATGFFSEEGIWTKSVANSSYFPYEYSPPLSLRSRLSTPQAVDSASSAKLMWGSYQEPVSILVAINYFRSVSPSGGETKLKECGMLPFESVGRASWGLESDQADLLAGYIHDKSIPYIGASPDGLIEYADGSMSILEVKNHSPFTRDDLGKGVGVRQEEFVGDGSVGTWHMAQLQLEILCAGKRCQNAVLIKSSIHSVSIYEVKRDNGYIMEMMHFLRKFYLTYVKSSRNSNRTRPIDENFFADEPRYRLFLETTNRMSREAKLIAKIDSKDVQRSPYNTDLLV